MHDLIPFNGSPGPFRRADSEARRDPLLDEAVVLLNDIVQLRKVRQRQCWPSSPDRRERRAGSLYLVIESVKLDIKHGRLPQLLFLVTAREANIACADPLVDSELDSTAVAPTPSSPVCGPVSAVVKAGGLNGVKTVE